MYHYEYNDRIWHHFTESYEQIINNKGKSYPMHKMSIKSVLSILLVGAGDINMVN